MSRDRIVILDDDPAVRVVLADALRRQGYEVLCAAGSDAALTLVTEHDPHLVLLDIAMAKMDGIETLERIRANLPDVPVVIISAYADVATASRVLASGAADYVTKPFDIGYLEQVVAIHLRAGSDRPWPPALSGSEAAQPFLRSIPGGRRETRHARRHLWGTPPA